MDQREPAPGSLATVQAFLNTAELDVGTDELGTIAQARAWLVAHDLAPPSRLSDVDRTYVCRVREALRDVVEANTGGAPPSASVRLLNEVLEQGEVRPVVAPDGSVVVTSGGRAIYRPLGALLAGVARAQVDATWGRFKTCANPECRWAFYDRSRNHSSTWCEMRTCGARHKMRVYRARSSR